MSMITRRQREIITIIANSKHPISGPEISEIIKVSERTTRNEISVLRKMFGEDFIVSQMGKGYKLSENYDVYSILSMQKELPVNRQIMILKEIVSNEGINFYDLADQYYISESTLENDIKVLNEMIAQRFTNVTLFRENNNIHMNAVEKVKREVTTYILAKEIKVYNFDFNNYINYFKHFNIVDLKEDVIGFLDDNDILIRDMALVTLVLHLGIMMERLYEGEALDEFVEFKIEGDQSHVEKFSCFVESLLDMTLPEAELNYLKVIFSSKLTVIDVEDQHKSDYLQFIRESLEQVKQFYQIDFTSDEQLIQSLYVHLISLIRRASTKRFLNNPLIDDIRENFPFIYDISVHLSLQIQERLKVTLWEDEIGYLSLHLMVAVEKINDRTLNILLVNPYGIGSSRFIKQRIVSNTDLNLNFKFLSTFDDDITKDQKYDLLLSTITLDKKYPIPSLQISTILSDKELKSVKSFLLDKKDVKGKGVDITYLFDEKLFFNQCEFENKEEVIAFLCDKLVLENYVDASYLESVMKRENIAPTAFGGNFAIPHPTEKIAKKSGIAIATLKKPITWGTQNISMVFLFSLSKDMDIITEGFDALVDLFEDEQRVKKLIEAKSFEAYLTEFKRYL